MNRLILIFFSLVSVLYTYAQRTETVIASTTFEASDDMSPKQAKEEAIKKAQLEAIADNFGTIVKRSNRHIMREKDGQSSEDFTSLTQSDVKGEWIETIGEPEWDTPEFKDNVTVYKLKALKGRIREIISASADIKYALLANGTDKTKNVLRNGTFYDGDYMYLYFRSPIHGYLSVYIVDNSSKSVQRILPYGDLKDNCFEIEADRDYVFFDKENKDIPGYTVRRLRMRANSASDSNEFYLVFSPNEFYKSNENKGTISLLPSIDFETFDSWLTKNIRRDDKMFAEHILVDVIKDKNE